MKLNKLNKLAAFVAAGAIAFGFASCDTGNGEYNAETPKTYYEYVENTGSVIASNSTSVTAKWVFSDASYTSTLPSGEEIIKNLIAPSSGEGAEITEQNLKAKLRTDATWGLDSATPALQTGKSSSSNLSNATEGYGFKIKTTGQTNIIARVAGAGGAEAARYLMITDKDGNPLVQKDSLASTKVVELVVMGAPAGEYGIWYNGSALLSLDCSYNTTYTKPLPMTEETVLTLSSDPSQVLEVGIDTDFTYKFYIDGVESSATWASSNEKVLTVKEGKITPVAAGTAVVRARVGRFYAESGTIVVKNRVTIVTKLTAGYELPLGGEDFDLGVTPAGVTVTSSNPEYCTVVNGKLHAVAAGDVTITMEKAGYVTQSFAVSVLPELEVSDSWTLSTITETPSTPLASAEGKYNLVKALGGHSNNWKYNKNDKPTTDEAFRQGLSLRVTNPSADGLTTYADGAYISFSGSADEKVYVFFEVYNNGGAKKWFWKAIDTKAEFVAADYTGATADGTTFTAENKGSTIEFRLSCKANQTLMFGGQGTDGLLIQKITVKTPKASE